MLSPNLSYQTIKTKDPEEWEFSPGISWEKEKDQTEEDFVSSKRFHIIPTTHQVTSQEETEAQRMMGQWWAGPHRHRDCFDVHVISLISGPPNMDFWGSLDLCPSFQCGSVE